MEPMTSTVPEGSTDVDKTTPFELCEKAASVATGGVMIGFVALVGLYVERVAVGAQRGRDAESSVDETGAAR